MNFTALVVEDDTLQREALAELLKDEGLEVVECTSAEAAELVGMSEAELRDVNRIPPSMLVQAGSALVVPRPEERLHDVPEHLAENGILTLASDTRGLRRVQRRSWGLRLTTREC